MKALSPRTIPLPGFRQMGSSVEVVEEGAQAWERLERDDALDFRFSQPHARSRRDSGRSRSVAESATAFGVSIKLF